MMTTATSIDSFTLMMWAIDLGVWYEFLSKPGDINHICCIDSLVIVVLPSVCLLYCRIIVDLLLYYRCIVIVSVLLIVVSSSYCQQSFVPKIQEGTMGSVCVPLSIPLYYSPSNWILFHTNIPLVAMPNNHIMPSHKKRRRWYLTLESNYGSLV